MEYKCGKCQKIFKSKSALTSHVNNKDGCIINESGSILDNNDEKTSIEIFTEMLDFYKKTELKLDDNIQGYINLSHEQYNTFARRINEIFPILTNLVSNIDVGESNKKCISDIQENIEILKEINKELLEDNLEYLNYLHVSRYDVVKIKNVFDLMNQTDVDFFKITDIYDNRVLDTHILDKYKNIRIIKSTPKDAIIENCDEDLKRQLNDSFHNTVIVTNEENTDTYIKGKLKTMLLVNNIMKKTTPK